MPVNVVKSARDERLWEDAKAQAEKEGRAKDWQYVMGIFERMKQRAGGAPRAALAKILNGRKGGK